MSMRDLISGEAELDDEENEDSFDEDGLVKSKEVNGNGNSRIDDSSEEEEDDDDEEAAQAIREGFIVEEEEDDEPEEQRRKRRKDKKRRRAERDAEQEILDDEDLDLIGENNPDYLRAETIQQSKFKRLKRGHKEDRNGAPYGGLASMFDEDEEAAQDYGEDRRSLVRQEPRGQQSDEFADFIEEDEFSGDEEERIRQEEAREVARPREKLFGTLADPKASGLDEETVQLLEDVFGDGNDYNWVLDQEEEAEDGDFAEREIELKDVFEPSQLAERLLTDEDNEIRWTDEPERFQIARRQYKHISMTEAESREESGWIANFMIPEKGLAPDLVEPFHKAVAKVLEFLITDGVEVPFIFQNRKDYLIHTSKVPLTPDPHKQDASPDEIQYVIVKKKLLNENDLWDIFELDLKFRAFIDKRHTIQATYKKLLKTGGPRDELFAEMIPLAVTMEELQDLQDYLHFQHISRIKDAEVLAGGAKPTQRRPGSQNAHFESLRSGRVYALVRAFGLTAEQFAQNALRENRRQYYTEDPHLKPEDIADAAIGEAPYNSSEKIITAAKQMFAEEITMSPKMRKVMRKQYYTTGLFSCTRTDKGLRKIDRDHPYYEFKYLRNQDFRAIARQPDLYLRMLKAEEEGLVEVKITLDGESEFRRRLKEDICSDNYSDTAEAWNKLREEVLDLALRKLHRIMMKSVKEQMKAKCELEVGKTCREELIRRLDQAPYKPEGMPIGTIPRVLTISNGKANRGDPIHWAWVEEDGRIPETGTFKDLSIADNVRPDVESVNAFVELVQRRKPDVVGVSGFTVDTRMLFDNLRVIIKSKHLRSPEFDEDNGESTDIELPIVMVNDEVARLYQNSPRAAKEHPAFSPMIRYCVALARYLQNPLKEYASLGPDLVSISFHPSQSLVPQERLVKLLDTAMVDMVNLCGVDINEAAADPYTSTLLPFVCGLGPRKATNVLKAINTNGGTVKSREELVGSVEKKKAQAVGPLVWYNCASFLYIEYDGAEGDSDYLDNTRVHPEDYDLGRKVAADALELDEEDVSAEMDENGPGAIVRKLIKEDAQEKVYDLILEEYAEQIERNFNQRKGSTLETIRSELQTPFEELRQPFATMSSDEIFTMLTGEASNSLYRGLVVPVKVIRVLEDELLVQLDNRIQGRIDEREIHNPGSQALRDIYFPNMIIPAKILNLDRKSFACQLTLLPEQVSRPERPLPYRHGDDWDEALELADKETLREKNTVTGRTQRVIKHPLFKPFNATQAEEYLGSLARGDAVIRPSSKGMDHLAVTWKVSDNIYQHIDVFEINKETEFSVGKKLIVGKYTYSDLDELIVNHVKAMTRKVDEMMLHDKYQSGSKTDCDNWLSKYSEANPKRSVYAFCIDPKHPGYFFICFKAGINAPLGSWPVKVVPQAFEMQKNAYPDMRALCNGFKIMFGSMINGKKR
ncbi:MAG: Transcription elongation factor spt6 [Trizodia sp. TS-e1964]|nr:MAG: Transcription elongation factor spt6 [Trizodia sp. TS-e1964]